MIYKANIPYAENFFSVVEETTGFTRSELTSRDRSEPLVSVRAICLVLLYEMYSDRDYAAKMLNRHFSTVNYAQSKHANRMGMLPSGPLSFKFNDKNYYDTFLAIKNKTL